MRLVIVTPIYEDQTAALKLFQELRQTLKEDFLVVAVDDGSIREPVEPEWLQSQQLQGCVVRLIRNLGHQRAIAVGLSYAAEHFKPAVVVVMDSDGEDAPASIKLLMERLDSEAVDVVVAQRKSRVETATFKAFYRIYAIMFTVLTGRAISFGNFMAIKGHVMQRLVSMPELWIHLAGCVLASKVRIAHEPIDRGARYAGQSKMNFISLALHGFHGLMVFAEDVLVRVGIFCTVLAVASLAAIFLVILLKVIGFATPGWFSIAIGILVLIFLQTGVLTLMTLMLTGILKGFLVPHIDYKRFIERVVNVSEATGRVSGIPK